jgi:hypothetical protein
VKSVAIPHKVFGTSLHVVCGSFLFTLVVIILRIVVPNTHCVLLLFCLSSACVFYAASFSWLSIRYFVTFMYTYAQNQVNKGNNKITELRTQLFINFLHILLFCFINNQVYVTFLLIPWIWNMSIYVLTYLKSDANFLCTEGTCMWNLFFFYFIYELNAFFVVLLLCKSVDWSTFCMKLQKMHWILIIGHERVLSIVICLVLVWLPLPMCWILAVSFLFLPISKHI